MKVAINSKLYQQASVYAQKKGLNLTAVIESFLLRFIDNSKTDEQPVPDVVLSLLGAGEQIADSDINGRGEYYKFLEEKYK